jgi:hypothetical protein
MVSRKGAFVCGSCLALERARTGERPGDAWQEAYCEWCGRTHAGRWVCLDRAERAAERVRLWLYEREGGLDETES